MTLTKEEPLTHAQDVESLRILLDAAHDMAGRLPHAAGLADSISDLLGEVEQLEAAISAETVR